MIDIGARSLIYGLRMLLLPDREVSKVHRDGNSLPWTRGIKIAIDVRISHRNSVHNGKETRRFIDVMILGHHDAFVTSTHNPNEPNEWTNVGNHDSCWIDSVETELNRIYFDMCKVVDDTVAPRDLNQQTWLSVFGDIRFVEAIIEPDDARNGATGCHVWKKIKTLNKISKDEFLAYNEERA